MANKTDKKPKVSTKVIATRIICFIMAFLVIGSGFYFLLEAILRLF